MIISKVVKHYSKINNNLRMKTSLVPDPRQQKGNEGSTRILELTRYIFQKANTDFFSFKNGANTEYGRPYFWTCLPFHDLEEFVSKPGRFFRLHGAASSCICILNYGVD
jgi:hypothetical protein